MVTMDVTIEKWKKKSCAHMMLLDA